MSFGHKSLFCAEWIGYVLPTGKYCCYFRMLVVTLLGSAVLFFFHCFCCIKGFILLGQDLSEEALRLFPTVKFLETGTDDFIDRGRAFRVASERFHQMGSFQLAQRIAGPLSLCFGMGVAVNDRQGFQHPFKINSRGIFAFSLYGKFLVLLFK